MVLSSSGNGRLSIGFAANPLDRQPTEITASTALVLSLTLVSAAA